MWALTWAARRLSELDTKQTNCINRFSFKEKYMLIAVIGGKLQGVEAVYLAQKAGWEVLVIDKNHRAPAAGLGSQFLEFEFTPEHPVPHGCPGVDLILPAIEDKEVLSSVKIWADLKSIPLAFDPEAYHLSSSKLKSDALFRKMNLPGPIPWPDCGFPVVIKPDGASGSQGIMVFKDSKAFFSRFPTQAQLDKLVIQEYMEGPTYSIEVLGHPGNYKALQVTDLDMDKTYDCKRVTAPTQLPFSQIGKFEEMALAIAEAIHLKGIMDVEVVLHENELKLLEIDARLPSQTPITVYWSTGINMVEMLGNLFLNQKKQDTMQKQAQFVVVEHIQVTGADLAVMGEHIMSRQGPLKLKSNFFGADEAITSFSPEKKKWVATMIFIGNTHGEMIIKKQNCYEQILEYTRPNSGDPLN